MDEIERTKLTKDIVARWNLDMAAVAMLHGPGDPQYAEYIEGLRKRDKMVDVMAERVSEIVDLFLKNRDYEKDKMLDAIHGCFEGKVPTEYKDSFGLVRSVWETLIKRQKDLDALVAEIARLQAEASRNMVKLSEARARIKDLEAELSDLKFYLDQLAAHNWCRRAKEAEARIKELDQECAYMDALTGAKMEAEAKWAKAEQHIKEKMDEIAALKGVITDMEADARRFPTMAEFSNLQDAYHDLEQEIAGLKAYKEATQNKESAREARIKELEVALERMLLLYDEGDYYNEAEADVCRQALKGGE